MHKHTHTDKLVHTNMYLHTHTVSLKREKRISGECFILTDSGLTSPPSLCLFVEKDTQRAIQKEDRCLKERWEGVTHWVHSLCLSLCFTFCGWVCLSVSLYLCVIYSVSLPFACCYPHSNALCHCHSLFDSRAHKYSHCSSPSLRFTIWPGG